MMGQFKTRGFAAIAVMALIALAARGQFLSTNKTDAVAFLSPAQATVPVGKPSPVNLRFRVAQGLHINSHIPSGDYLIPTTLSIPDGAGARLDTAIYPNGSFISLPIDPKNKLSVYTGEFVIQARIVATAGSHTIQAKLRYQACDQHQCLPPKTITVPIQVIGK
jgi:hypothetical protein